MDLRGIHTQIKNGNRIPAKIFYSLFNSTPNYLEALKLRRLWNLNIALPSNEKIESYTTQKLKLAITGTGTLDYLANLIQDGFIYKNQNIELYTSSYNNYVSDIMDKGSTLWKFEPDCIIFVIDSKQIWSLLPPIFDDEIIVQQTINSDISFISSLLEPFLLKGIDTFVINAIPQPYTYPGPIRRAINGSVFNFVQQWNAALSALEFKGLKIVDAYFEALMVGAQRAFDLRQWYESKQPYSLDFQPIIASRIVEQLITRKQADKKVIVVDSDNTIWGGVIGDDGLEGIEIGTISARAQAYKALQALLKDLKAAGFLLAICSKNEENIVLNAFRNHEEMVLREDDIVSFKVNWKSKADNIAEIAAELNLGMDSFIFIDDNPAEISIVNQFAPDVETVLASDDPVKTIEMLYNSNLFYRRSITSEDSKKTQQYKAEKKRRELASTITNYEDYLISLKMTAEVEFINRESIVRSVQLINKSNQFNLTTIRRTEAELLSICNNDAWRCFTVRLKDKFDDHGIIAVILAAIKKDNIFVETFVMSCRVLKRDVESLILNQLFYIAKAEDIPNISGIYRPTKKNTIVENLYKDLGFQQMVDSAEQKEYCLAVESYEPINHNIKLTKDLEKRNECTF